MKYSRLKTLSIAGAFAILSGCNANKVQDGFIDSQAKRPGTAYAIEGTTANKSVQGKIARSERLSKGGEPEATASAPHPPLPEPHTPTFMHREEQKTGKYAQKETSPEASSADSLSVSGRTMRLSQQDMAERRADTSVLNSPRSEAQLMQSPDMYVANTYEGGGGSRERVEALVNAGVMIEGKRVKLDSFSRNYAQTFPIPTQTALSLSADMERTKIIRSGDRAFLQIGLQSLQGESLARAPLNVALVIDCSGSMSGQGKLEHAKAAAMQLLDSLAPQDSFSLITFRDAAHVEVPSRSANDKAAIKRIIARLSPGGGTNIYEGLQFGYREALKRSNSEGVNRVLLLSDGEVTAGERNPLKFDALIGNNERRDIQTTSIGLGIDFNEDLMMRIAKDGKGNYHFIKDGADTQTVFKKELNELTHVVAKAVKLRIKLAEGVGLVRALGTSALDETQTAQVKQDEKRIDRKVQDELGILSDRQDDADEPGIKLLIPNFYLNTNHIVMLELQIPAGFGNRKVADVFLKCKDLVTHGNRQAVASVSLNYVENRSEMIASMNRSVKKNLLGFQTGEALTEAANLISQGRVSEAVRQVDERMVVMGVAAKTWNDRDLDRDGALLSRYKSVLTRLNPNQRIADTELGQYLCKSMSYAGYKMTR